VFVGEAGQAGAGMIGRPIVHAFRHTMARIQIDLPEHFLFSTEIPIYIGHINYGHHLDNALLLQLVSEARVRFFKSLGYTELDIEGVGASAEALVVM